MIPPRPPYHFPLLCFLIFPLVCAVFPRVFGFYLCGILSFCPGTTVVLSWLPIPLDESYCVLHPSPTVCVFIYWLSLVHPFFSFQIGPRLQPCVTPTRRPFRLSMIHSRFDPKSGSAGFHRTNSPVTPGLLSLGVLVPLPVLRPWFPPVQYPCSNSLRVLLPTPFSHPHFSALHFGLPIRCVCVPRFG